jgi:hypothetical protein
LELQLDLKEYAPLDFAVPKHLANMLDPVRDSVRVTGGADWALRRLRAIDPDPPLGFDPLFYLDWDNSPNRSTGEPP